LTEERIRLKLTKEQLAQSTGIIRNTQYQYEKNKLTPKISYLVKLAELGFHTQYLLFGASASEADGTPSTNSPDSDGLVRLPVYQANTGQPIPKSQWFPKAWFDQHNLPLANLALVVVTGEPMLTALRHQDWVIIDTSLTDIDGHTYAFRLDGTILVRNVQRQAKNTVQIAGINPAYPPYTLDMSAADFTVIGKVVTALHYW